MYRGQRVQRRKNLAITSVVGAAMLVAGAGVGGALASRGTTAPLAAGITPPTSAPATPTTVPTTTPTTTPTTVPSTVPSSSSGTPTNLVSSVTLSHLIGEVMAVSSNSLVVKDQSGALHTIALSPSTVYMNKTVRTTFASVHVRSIVFVQGVWSPTRTTLNARMVGIAGAVSAGGDDSSGDGNGSSTQDS